jgi:Flp pilus assembly protein protease CpaA
MVMPALAYFPIAAWLAACVVCDLKTRQVPNTLTLSALLAAAIWRAISGEWLVVGMVLILIAVSDLARIPRLLTAWTAWIVCLVMGGSPQSDLSIPLFGAWLLWDLEVMGGADAKMLTALLLLTGSPLLFPAVLLAGGLQGLVGLLRKEQTIPYTVAIATGTVCYWAAELLL